MPLSMLKNRLSHHQADVEEAGLDRQPSTISTSDPTTPLMDITFPEAKSSTKRPYLRVLWRRFWACNVDLRHPEPKKRLVIRLVVLLPLLCLTVFLLVILYFATISSVLSVLQPPTPNNGLQKIVDEWNGSGSIDLESMDSHNFSALVTPIPCHSHNDYAHRVSLFEALSVGCISVEADVYAPPDTTDATDLLIGHKHPTSGTKDTLQTLYLGHLLAILNAMNPSLTDNLSSDSLSGPFSTNTSTPLTLLIDLKETSPSAITRTLTLLNTSLTPLRSAHYLTTHNITTSTLTPGPLTIVLTGSANLLHITNTTLNPHHDLFLDAPLHALFPDPSKPEDSPYNTTNSALASTSLDKHIGGPSFLTGRFSASQISLIETQLAQARSLGLPSRYWGTPAWPVERRGTVWRSLLEWGWDVVNVDALSVFARWDWEMSRAAGWCWLFGGVLGEGMCR